MNTATYPLVNLSPDGLLAGRTAVVTGAAGKLGPVWCAAMLDAGADVLGLVLPSAMNDASLSSLRRRDRFSLAACDVTDRASLESIATSSKVPDVLVVNAGLDHPPGAPVPQKFEDVPPDVFQDTLDVNLRGVFHTLQAFGPRMAAAGRGSVVVVGSLYASSTPDPALYDHMEPAFLKPPAYVASKAGAVHLARYAAKLWGPRGVRVNALSPGGVEGGQDAQFVRKFTSRIPLGRLARADDLVRRKEN